MALEGWDQDGEGNVTLCPLMAWDTAASTRIGLLRLVYAEHSGDFKSGGQSRQLGLSPDQIRALAEELLRLADFVGKQGVSRQ